MSHLMIGSVIQGCKMLKFNLSIGDLYTNVERK